MKKLKFVTVILIILLLQGCILDDPKYINLKDKPSPNFYTKEIQKKILEGNSFSLVVFNTNLFKNMPVPEEDLNIIENFISEISTENFKDDIDLINKEPYEIKITFEDSSKYIIKVFDNNTVTVSPWDGVFKSDYIVMTDIPEHYNLYDFCTHIDFTDVK